MEYHDGWRKFYFLHEWNPFHSSLIAQPVNEMSQTVTDRRVTKMLFIRHRDSQITVTSWVQGEVTVTELWVSSFTTRLKIELINAPVTSILLVIVHSLLGLCATRVLDGEAARVRYAPREISPCMFHDESTVRIEDWREKCQFLFAPC